MSLWIPFTLLAAFMQAMRNALQKQLSKDVPVLGVIERRGKGYTVINALKDAWRTVHGIY